MARGIYPRTKKHRKIISVSMTGRKRKPFSDEWKEKIRRSNLGKKRSEETKERLRLSHSGYKQTEKHKKTKSGNKSHFWKGGISFEPYSVDWTRTLKRSIRERDHYTCRICGNEPATHVHHIDYNKENCSPDNLVTLCNSCHTGTNFDRSYWIDYFRRL